MSPKQHNQEDDTEIDSIHEKMDRLLAEVGDRKVSLSDIRVSLVGVFMALLALGTPTGLVIANHYRIETHLADTRIHANAEKSSMLGGVAYAGEMAARERQEYFVIKALNCGSPTTNESASRAICASNYPDGPFPSLSGIPFPAVPGIPAKP